MTYPSYGPNLYGGPIQPPYIIPKLIIDKDRVGLQRAFQAATAIAITISFISFIFIFV